MRPATDPAWPPATGGPPQRRRSSLWIQPCGARCGGGPPTPSVEFAAQFAQLAVRRRRRNLPEAVRFCSCSSWRREQVAHRRASSSPGCPDSRPPRRCPPAWRCRTTNRRRSPGPARRWRPMIRNRSPGSPGSSRRCSRNSSRADRPGLPVRLAQHVVALLLELSLASSSRLGTDGRKMLAVSPGCRDRTNRPIAWAKNSGVDALVAYTPTASRGTSTPSGHHPHRQPASDDDPRRTSKSAARNRDRRTAPPSPPRR